MRQSRSYGSGGSRQGCNPAGESPAMPIARFRHVAIPQFMWATAYSMRGVNGPAALRRLFLAVGATWGSSEHGGLNITE
jgi:hypothetical protein